MSFLVDTSVWIEWLHGKNKPNERVLESIVVCGPVVQEVLQGLKNTSAAKAFRESFLQFPIIVDPLPASIFRHGAELYRRGREKGYTIRSSIDCLIAAIAIDAGVPVLHKDRDFSNITKFSNLESRTIQSLKF